jgi:hypothetical protein
MRLVVGCITFVSTSSSKVLRFDGFDCKVPRSTLRVTLSFNRSVQVDSWNGTSTNASVFVVAQRSFTFKVSLFRAPFFCRPYYRKMSLYFGNAGLLRIQTCLGLLTGFCLPMLPVPADRSVVASKHSSVNHSSKKRGITSSTSPHTNASHTFKHPLFCI